VSNLKLNLSNYISTLLLLLLPFIFIPSFLIKRERAREKSPTHLNWNSSSTRLTYNGTASHNAKREENSIEWRSRLFAFMLYLSSIFIKTFSLHSPLLLHPPHDGWLWLGWESSRRCMNGWKDFYGIYDGWQSVESSCKINQWARLFISLSSVSRIVRCLERLSSTVGWTWERAGGEMSFAGKSHLFAQMLVQHHRQKKLQRLMGEMKINSREQRTH
jgi:hypothetical protein